MPPAKATDTLRLPSKEIGGKGLGGGCATHAHTCKIRAVGGAKSVGAHGGMGGKAGTRNARLLVRCAAPYRRIFAGVDVAAP